MSMRHGIICEVDSKDVLYVERNDYSLVIFKKDDVAGRDVVITVAYRVLKGTGQRSY